MKDRAREVELLVIFYYKTKKLLMSKVHVSKQIKYLFTPSTLKWGNTSEWKLKTGTPFLKVIVYERKFVHAKINLIL